MFGLGFGLKYWMNSYLGGAVSSAISWLLPFNLNLSATVGDDAVMAVGSDTTARVWDETDGLVLATVSAGNPVSEGMRLATTVADGAELGVEILPALSLGGWTDTDPNGEIVGDTVVYTGSTAGTAGIYYVNPPVVVGEKYIVSCTVAGFSGSGILRLQIGNQLSSPNITADGSYEFEIDYTSGLTRFILRAELGFTGVVSNISLKEVLPTFLNDDGSGNKLTPSKTGSNGEEIMLVFDAWADATVYAAGSYVVDFVGVQAKYYSTVAGGTSSGTGVADDTGVTWVLEGNYNNLGGGHLTHVLNEPEATNLFLNSEVPVTQDITTTAQNYTVSVWGTGSVTLSGTATGVATQDSPLTVTAAAGTLTCTVAGSLDIVQVETGDVNTTFIPTLGGTVTRVATSFTGPNPLPSSNHQGRLRFVYMGTPLERIIDDIKDSSNRLRLYWEGTQFVLSHSGGGVTKFAIVPKIPSVGEVVHVGWFVDLDSGAANIAINGVIDATPPTGLLARVPADSLFIGSSDAGANQGNPTDLQVYTVEDSDWYKDIAWSDPE